MAKYLFYFSDYVDILNEVQCSMNTGIVLAFKSPLCKTIHHLPLIQYEVMESMLFIIYLFLVHARQNIKRGNGSCVQRENAAERANREMVV